MTTVVPPDSPSGRSGEFATAESESKRLSDEYKIIQDKIDKIGAFKFTIKGWSVTVVIAALAAGKATDLPIIGVTLGLALMLTHFFFLELQQVKISRILGERARKLETRFRIIDRRSSQGVGFASPYIAHEIALAHYDAGRRKKGSDRWKVAREADLYFYVTLVILAFALGLLVQYSEETQPEPMSQSPSPPPAEEAPR